MLAQTDGAPWAAAPEPLAPALLYDLAVTGGGVPASGLGQITAPVLIPGGQDSPGWFQRPVAGQAAATPGAQLTMPGGYDHDAPPEVITPTLAGFFGTNRHRGAPGQPPAPRRAIKPVRARPDGPPAKQVHGP